jgi:hypothetical protein
MRREKLGILLLVLSLFLPTNLLVLFPRHFNTLDRAFETISQIQLFRDYFHYHIKCSKAYMHSRMRQRYLVYLDE